MPLESQLLNDRYKLIAQIASGGMAQVYKAQDTLLNRIVAVKILRESFAEDPAFQRRFVREAQSAANLSHPNIVAVYDFGRDGERQYIVMEYVEGRDLKSVLHSTAPLPIPYALNIAMQICAGVGAAHRAGIVHCDVKPQNVLLTTDGQAKVTDFGIARAFMASAPGGYTESVWGTPHYFSPEQAAGEQPTPASDVYSIGVILFEMLTGRLPFEGENQQQLALAHLRDTPPPITQVNPVIPVEIEHIINQVLSKEPSQRYRTADQLGRILYEYQRSTEQATSFQPSPVAALSRPATYAQQVAPQPAALQPVAPSADAGGTDWPAWILAVVALIAVVGLVVLWGTVYMRYTSAPRIPPTPTLAPPTATVTNAGQRTSVPDVLHLDRKDAESKLKQSGLAMVVKEERSDDQWPAGAVLEQSPQPEAAAKRGDLVQVAVSKGPRVNALPMVQGFNPYTDVVKGLETYGWKVAIEPQWSTRPTNEVVAQIPLPGTPLTAGQVITLQVSSGSLIPIDANFNNLIMLESAELPRDTLPPGETLQVELRWKLRAPSIPQPYKVFVHLIGPAGNLVAQVDREPQDGRAPTTAWRSGVLVADPYAFEIPRDAPRGVYQLRVGLYPASNPSLRLPITDPGRLTAENNSLRLKDLTVGP